MDLSAEELAAPAEDERGTSALAAEEPREAEFALLDAAEVLVALAETLAEAPAALDDAEDLVLAAEALPEALLEALLEELPAEAALEAAPELEVLAAEIVLVALELAALVADRALLDWNDPVWVVAGSFECCVWIWVLEVVESAAKACVPPGVKATANASASVVIAATKKILGGVCVARAGAASVAWADASGAASVARDAARIKKEP